MLGGGNISLPFWAARRSRFGASGVMDVLVDVPLNWADDKGWRENGFRLGWGVWRVKAR